VKSIGQYAVIAQSASAPQGFFSLLDGDGFVAPMQGDLFDSLCLAP
jgi:hypothetical protein